MFSPQILKWWTNVCLASTTFFSVIVIDEIFSKVIVIDPKVIDNSNRIIWTLDKPMASLSTCHQELVVWDGNLVKPCYYKD